MVKHRYHSPAKCCQGFRYKNAPSRYQSQQKHHFQLSQIPVFARLSTHPFRSKTPPKMAFWVELTPIRFTVLLLLVGILIHHSVSVYRRSIRSRFPDHQYPVDVSSRRREDYWERYIDFNLSHPGNFLTYGSNHSFRIDGISSRSTVAWMYQHKRWSLSMSIPLAETSLPLLRALRTRHPFQSLDIVEIVHSEVPLTTEDPEAFLCAQLIAVISEISDLLIQSPRLRQLNITWRQFHCRAIFFAYPLHIRPPEEFPEGEEEEDDENSAPPLLDPPPPPNEWRGAVISFSPGCELYGMTRDRLAPHLGEVIRLLLHMDRVEWAYDENYAVRKAFFTK